MKYEVGMRVWFNTKEPQNCASYTDDVLTIIADYGDDSFEVRYPSGLEQTVEAYDLEPAAVAPQPQPPAKEPLRIEAGKFYITRDGRKVGPAAPSGDTDYPWRVGESTYTDSGAWVDGLEDDNDLVAEADEPPAEQQSTKEILDELEAWIAEQDAIKAAGKSSTAGFTVPLFDEDDEPGWYAAELGRAYADGYAAGLRAAA